MAKIFIDADGCPVIDETIALGKKHHIPCTIICDRAHEFYRDGAETIMVDIGADSVDFALVNRLSPGDFVITQDYGLAAMCLGRSAFPIDQNGRVYDRENIDALLLSRHVAQKIRRGGGRLKGQAKRKKEQNESFVKAFEALLLERGEGG